ncbi:MAG TPA: rod shape-determining protein MreD [Spirochaetia bacterium]|nr:rod shape-determining protein MreD [Spirochaetia bacterium]
MFKTILVAVATSVGCSLLQSTWLHAVAVYAVIPDLALLVIVYVAFQNVRTEGIAAGFLSGLLQDFISSAPLGFNAFVRTVVSFGFNLISGSFYIDRILMPMLFGGAATLLKALATALLAIAFPAFIHGYDFLDRVLWIETAYNAVLAPFLFLILGLLKSLFVTARNRG